MLYCFDFNSTAKYPAASYIFQIIVLLRKPNTKFLQTNILNKSYRQNYGKNDYSSIETVSGRTQITQ